MPLPFAPMSLESNSKHRRRHFWAKVEADRQCSEMQRLPEQRQSAVWRTNGFNECFLVHTRLHVVPPRHFQASAIGSFLLRQERDACRICPPVFYMLIAVFTDRRCHAIFAVRFRSISESVALSTRNINVRHLRIHRIAVFFTQSEIRRR